MSGFDPGTDALDLHSLLAAANIDLSGNLSALGNYLTVTDQGADALVSFDPSGHGGGGTVAVLHGLGASVGGLDALIAKGAIRMT